MIKKITLCILCFLLFSNVASSKEPSTQILQITGNQYYQWCNSDSSLDQGLCLGYVMGASDGLSWMQILSPITNWTPICIPPNVDLGQKRDVIVKYLSNHPEERHELISVLTTV